MTQSRRVVNHKNGLRYSCAQCEYAAAAEDIALKTHCAEYTQVERALKENNHFY